MKHTLLKAALGVCILTAAALTEANAQAITVKRATMQRELSTREPQHNHSDTKIEIIWNSQTPPKDIFFRADAAHWLKCKITRSERRPFGGGPNDYAIVENRAQPETLKKGEALTLRPEDYPSDVQPDAVKKMPAGALFYQLQGSNKWVAEKVKMTKLPDAHIP